VIDIDGPAEEGVDAEGAYAEEGSDADEGSDAEMDDLGLAWTRIRSGQVKVKSISQLQAYSECRCTLCAYVCCVSDVCAQNSMPTHTLIITQLPNSPHR